MVNSLLNHVLVLRVIRIKDPDRLPASFALCYIFALKREAGQKCGQSSALRIHTRLHDLLTATEVRVAVDVMPRTRHGGNPETEEEGVTVVGGPFFRTLESSLVRFEESFTFLLTLNLSLLLGCVFDVVCGGSAVGSNNGCEKALLAQFACVADFSDGYIPTNVPVDATRKARNGTVSARKEAYRLLAAATPTAPTAVPIRPPIDPPLTVALSLC